MKPEGITLVVSGARDSDALLQTLASAGMQTLRRETEAIVCGAEESNLSPLRAMLEGCGVPLRAARDVRQALDGAAGEYAMLLEAGCTLNGAFALEILREKMQAGSLDALRCALQMPWNAAGRIRMRGFPCHPYRCHGALYRMRALRERGICPEPARENASDAFFAEADEACLNARVMIHSARGALRSGMDAFAAVCVPWAAERPGNLPPSLCTGGALAAGLERAARVEAARGGDDAPVRAIVKDGLGLLYVGNLEAQMAGPEAAAAYRDACRGKLKVCLEEPLRPENEWLERLTTGKRDFYFRQSQGMFFAEESADEFLRAIR